MRTEAYLREIGQRAGKCACFVLCASQRYGIPAAWLVAVGARESDWYNVIGDCGHGHGIGQVDDRSWNTHNLWVHFPRPPGVKGQDAMDPESNIYFMAALLRENLDTLKGYNHSDPLRAACAAYNCGVGCEEWVLTHGFDFDARTTGHDYSRDVEEMATWFQVNLPWVH